MSKLSFTLPLIAAMLFTSPALAQKSKKNPYAKPNNSWISISGTVDSVRADEFTLDYGKGIVTVEMDDGDRDADAYKLIKGDKVTVSGKIDDDLFEATTIEAASIYVENLGTYFYSSSVDEEDIDAFVTVTTPLIVSTTFLQGKVTSVDATEEEFTLDTGKRKITVEVDAMPYNPLDDVGYQQIKKGAYVSVSGTIDHDFFEGRVFEADTVVTLTKPSAKKSKKAKSKK